MLVLRNCSLVPELTEGCTLTKADIVISGEIIERIVPCGTHLGDDVQELDIKGATVLPGLIDIHCHLFMNTNKNEGFNSPNVLPGERAFHCLKYANYLLDRGYTSLRDIGDFEYYPAVAVRNAIDSGIVTGPRIKTAGVMLIPPEAGTYGAREFCYYVSGQEEFRKAARDVLMQGADLIKIYGTGSMLSHGSTPGKRILEEDEIAAAVSVARMKDTYVACHCHGEEAIDTMVRLGVRTIEHASFISEETLKRMDGRRDVGIVPTVGISSPEVLRRDNYGEAVLKRFDGVRQKLYDCLRNAYEHDILIGWGTDFFMEAFSEFPYIEFKVRKEKLGFSNIDILKQVTINSAQLMQTDDMVGTVKAGKYADFAVFDGNPVDDITLMYDKPLHVIKGGVVIR